MVDDETTDRRKTVKDLQGKRIVVTGGCGILGVVMCEYLLDLGAIVVILDVAESDPAAKAAELGAGSNGTAHGYAADLADSDSLRALTDRIVAEVGVVTMAPGRVAMIRPGRFTPAASASPA